MENKYKWNRKNSTTLNNIFKKIQTKYIEASKDYKDLNKYKIYKKIVNINFDKINKDILSYIK